MNPSTRSQRGHVLHDVFYVLGIVAAFFLVSAPGYFQALQNGRAQHIRHELVRLAQAKETWAVANKAPLGTEVTGGIAMLVEKGFLEYEPASPVSGKWILGEVGEVPRFLPDPEEGFRPALDFALYLPPEDLTDVDADVPAAESSPEPAGETDAEEASAPDDEAPVAVEENTLEAESPATETTAEPSPAPEPENAPEPTPTE